MLIPARRAFRRLAPIATLGLTCRTIQAVGPLRPSRSLWVSVGDEVSPRQKAGPRPSAGRFAASRFNYGAAHPDG